MSLLDGLDNRTAELEVYAGTSGYGKSTYAAPQTIAVRKEPASGTARTSTGDDVQVETLYFSKVRVTLSDRVDGHVIRRVEEKYDLDGVLDHYEFAV